MNNDLSLCTTGELIDELFRRSDNGVVCLSSDREIEGSVEDRTIGVCANWSGSLMACVGLCEHVKLHILDAFDTDSDEEKSRKQ